jgi:MoaA/NifB/PqqE/SkfB family radical SAM enzyme
MKVQRSTSGALVARGLPGGFQLLSHRDGRRVLLAGGPARVFARVLERLSLDDLEQLALEPEGQPGFDELLAFLRDVFARLGSASRPTTVVDIFRQRPDFQAAAIAARLPLLAMVELTHRCSLRCGHCYILSQVSAARPAQATGADVARLLHQLAEAGALDVTFTGGEATLHPGWRALITLAKDLHLETSLKTNGAGFTAASARAYARDAAHETHVSLYGASAAVHDAFTLGRGSFERTRAGLRHLAAAGVRCLVTCVVWSGNANELPAIETLVRTLGHDVTFNDLIHGRLDGDRSPLGLRLTPTQRDALVAAGYLRAFEPEPCLAGTLKAKIGPEGTLSPCELVHGTGDVFASSFAAQWQAPSFIARGRALVRLSTSERRDGQVLRTCPALNRLDTGRMTGPTTIC